jgi:hypothetical protein
VAAGDAAGLAAEIERAQLERAKLDDSAARSGLEQWLELNTKFSAEWPNITTKKDAPADADEFKGVDGKFEKFFSPEPGEGD